MSNPDFSRLRAAMVSNQLRTNAVTDPAILSALDGVERDRFVPADRAALAYVDVPVPLGNGRSLNPPLSTARLVQEAKVAKGQSVLLIGAATGYTATLLDRLGCTVTAVECDAALVAQARTALDTAAVTLVEGPLEAGHGAGAPYDAIIVDGSVEQLPEALWQQLKEGGRIVSGLNDAGVPRLVLGIRSGESRALRAFLEIDSAPLPGFAAPRGFAF